jgi:hypothetical protein
MAGGTTRLALEESREPETFAPGRRTRFAWISLSVSHIPCGFLGAALLALLFIYPGFRFAISLHPRSLLTCRLIYKLLLMGSLTDLFTHSSCSFTDLYVGGS